MTDTEKKSSSGSEDHSIHTDRKDGKGDIGGMLAADVGNREHLNAVFDNPLANIDDDQLMLDVEDFCQRYDLMDQLENMKKGAKVSKRPNQVADADFLTQDEKDVLLREKTHKWDHPWMLYWLCTMCSLAAATQGMDETANNGALPIYSEVGPCTIQRPIFSADFRQRYFVSPQKDSVPSQRRTTSKASWSRDRISHAPC